MDQRHLTGWEIESHIQVLLEAALPGTRCCVFCIADMLDLKSAQDARDIAQAMRRVGTDRADQYEVLQGKCAKHTGQSGAGTFWMIRKR